MTPTGMRIQEVSYDAAAGTYSGSVTFYEPDGTRILRVTTPGHPSWGYERTLQALNEAGHRARMSALSAPSAERRRPGTRPVSRKAASLAAAIAAAAAAAKNSAPSA